jgi:hypothetical protein
MAKLPKWEIQWYLSIKSSKKEQNIELIDNQRIFIKV